MIEWLRLQSTIALMAEAGSTEDGDPSSLA